ncbi:MAG: cytochrome c oxidase accessory protein CcoG [Flavobacteriaceae bacterium]
MAQDQENFRDSIGTIDDEGKRAWIYPKKPSGRFYRNRKYVSYFLLAFLFIAPFAKVNGNQFLMFNVLERRFNIFGFPFWPQDFHLFVISMIIGVIFIALFTVAYGRIFCGWMCPQTIFMEMVFRRIEFWIDGDRNQQRKLDRQKWNAEKIRKRLIKWTIFFLISFLIANVFLAYLIGSDRLLRYITEGPMSHLGTLAPLLIFTLVFYFVFAWFREQVCIIACPYGRMQGVLLDNKSIVVAYDHKRGEGENGRKKFRKNEDRQALGHGDCIDCMQCVHVCPTGIDIRNGTQLECVNCTACIDECDTIMEKINLPKGLIRYASENEIVKNEKFRFTPRLKGYTGVLAILTSALIAMLFLRNDIEASILKISGQQYIKKENNVISNIYNYTLVNKTNRDVPNISFKLIGIKGAIQIIGEEEVTIPAREAKEGTIFIDISSEELKQHENKLKVGIYSEGQLIETTTAQFMSPQNYF